MQLVWAGVDWYGGKSMAGSLSSLMIMPLSMGGTVVWSSIGLLEIISSK